MSLPTVGEEYQKLMEHCRKAQESAAMLSHLRGAEGDAHGQMVAKGWLAIAEMFRIMQHKVTLMAQGRLQ